MLRTKSVWTKIDRRKDGLRLLVTRFRGRGVPGSRYDAWVPSLGPSERLLGAVLSGKISWPAFARAYRKELFLDGPIDRKSRTIKNHGQKFTLRLVKALARKGHVTLMCHCAEDERRCHRHLLRELIASNRVVKIIKGDTVVKRARSLAEISEELARFAAARDWDQFHNPKNLAMALSGEAGEVLEHFQWLTPEQAADLPAETRGEVALECADVLLFLLRLCDKLEIDLVAAARRKLRLNAKKYPVRKARGRATKYDRL